MHSNNLSVQPLEQAQSMMLEAGLPMPPVPKILSDKLQNPDKASYFSTRNTKTHESAPGPWNLTWFLQEVEQKTPDQYMIFGIDGHGVESAATHYYLVEDDIAVFHQSQLSSPAHPQVEESLADQYELIAIMAVATTEAKEKGKLPKEGRIVVVRPGSLPSAWGIQSAPGQPVEWLETSDPLLDACSWLSQNLK